MYVDVDNDVDNDADKDVDKGEDDIDYDNDCDNDCDNKNTSISIVIGSNIKRKFFPNVLNTSGQKTNSYYSIYTSLTFTISLTLEFD